MPLYTRQHKGFSLLEVVIIVAILGILAGAGAESYRTFGKDSELLSAKKTLIADLRYAQSRAMIGEGGFKWGVHVVSGATDYYEVFSTPTDYTSGSMTQVSTTTLSKALDFALPISGSSQDIIFSKISGTTTATALHMTAEDRTEIITITELGTIY